MVAIHQVDLNISEQMTKFSERIGAVQVPKIVQIGSINHDLRNSIWNFLLSIYDKRETGRIYERFIGAGWSSVTKYIAKSLLKIPVDELPRQEYQLRNWLKEKYVGMAWHEVYDLVEMVCNGQCHKNELLNMDGGGMWNTARLQAAFNKIFETELSGYRFIEGKLVPITNPTEIESINEALEASDRVGLQGAHTHISTALELFAQRPQPDYRNSMKEAISAIESMARKLTGKESDRLSVVLNALEEKIPIHKAMKEGFLKLYGYTSNAPGVRHALIDEDTIGFDEAKYMIVICSAFVNFVATKAQAVDMLRLEN